MWHDSSIHVTWLIYMWHDSFMCVIWLGSCGTWVMAASRKRICLRDQVSWLFHAKCHMTYLYVRHDSFIWDINCCVSKTQLPVGSGPWHMRHGTHVNGTCHICEWVKWHTCEWVCVTWLEAAISVNSISISWLKSLRLEHAATCGIRSATYESGNTREWVMSHTRKWVCVTWLEAAISINSISISLLRSPRLKHATTFGIRSATYEPWQTYERDMWHTRKWVCVTWLEAAISIRFIEITATRRCNYNNLYLEWHLISIFNPNLIRLFLAERGHSDWKSLIIDWDLSKKNWLSKCNRLYLWECTNTYHSICKSIHHSICKNTYDSICKSIHYSTCKNTYHSMCKKTYHPICKNTHHSICKNTDHSICKNTYSQLQIGWHSILRLFLKTFNLVPGVPGFSWDSSFITWY